MGPTRPCTPTRRTTPSSGSANSVASFAPGWFGENLRLEGIDVNGARIGEVWRIGDSVEVEVTMPRTPCATFARWVGGAAARGWVKRFSDEGRLGAYLRVRRAGEVRAGDPVTIVSSPSGAPTVLQMYRA